MDLRVQKYMRYVSLGLPQENGPWNLGYNEVHGCNSLAIRTSLRDPC